MFYFRFVIDDRDDCSSRSNVSLESCGRLAATWFTAPTIAVTRAVQSMLLFLKYGLNIFLNYNE
jgi:hypothetical protein